MLKIFLGALLFATTANADYKNLTSEKANSVVGKAIQLVKNSNAEAGSAGYTNSGGGTYALVTAAANVAEGNRSFSWDASANADTLTTTQFTIPSALGAASCVAKFVYKGGDANIVAEVVDGALSVLASTTLSTRATFNSPDAATYLGFNCPAAASTVALRLRATANAAIIYFDLVTIGSLGNAKVRTITTLMAGSGTYTPPLGVSYLKVRMVGSGGGGAGSSNLAGNGGGGGGGNVTTFGSSFLTANGGGAGPAGAGGVAVGGTGTINAGATGFTLQGGSGGGAGNTGSATTVSGGMGGANPFGGAGSSAGNAAGTAGAANTGAGGGGGGSPGSASNIYGGGGGAGAYIEAIVYPVAASYAYSVGAAGTAGSAGTSGFQGGQGGAGSLIIEEYYE